MRLRSALVIVFLAVLIWSAIRPHDYFTWILEVFPALFGIAILFATRRSFPLTPLLYVLLLIHAVILMVGGHYTYAEVPIGDWARDTFGLARNHYDRIGHFAQGFIPAIVAREILIRRDVVRGRGWLFTIIVSICLAISAAYELLEWIVAVWSGSKGDAFLGTQGDIWDTQKDMALAMFGAMVAQWTLGKLHDKQLASLHRAPTTTNAAQ